MITTLTKEQTDYLCEQFGLDSIAEIHHEQQEYIVGHLEKLAKIKEAEAEERGAREMAQVVCDECKRCQDTGESQAILMEELMGLWRARRRK